MIRSRCGGRPFSDSPVRVAGASTVLTPILFSLASCAAAGAPPGPSSASADRSCTRLEAAHGLTKKWLFEGVPNLQRKAIDDCGRGDIGACAAVPLATPYALVMTPLFPIFGFFASEANAKHHCS